MTTVLAELLGLVNLATAVTIFITAPIARLLHVISHRTLLALWSLGLALNVVRLASQDRYGWATVSAVTLLWMAWAWWDERPGHRCPGHSPHSAEERP